MVRFAGQKAKRLNVKLALHHCAGWATMGAIASWPEWLTRGQHRPVPQRVTFVTWKHWNKDDTLRPSGLIGPVTLHPASFEPLPENSHY